MRTTELAWQNFNFTIKLFVFCPRNPTSLTGSPSQPHPERQNWLVVEPTHPKNISQNGVIFLKFRDENKKYLSCHHLEKERSSHNHQFSGGDVWVSGRVFLTQCSAMSNSISANDGCSLVVWVGGLDSCDPLMKGIVGGSPRISNHQPKPPIFH